MMGRAADTGQRLQSRHCLAMVPTDQLVPAATPVAASEVGEAMFAGLPCAAALAGRWVAATAADWRERETALRGGQCCWTATRPGLPG
jgi:hypothetical protein